MRDGNRHRLKRRYAPRGPKYQVPDHAHALVAVDLGKWKLGAAIGLVDPSDGTKLLAHAQTLTFPHRRGQEHDPHAVAAWLSRELPVPDLPVVMVCEWPQAYGDDIAGAEAIEDLWAVGDAMEVCFGRWSERYRPAQWKGNVPKLVHRRRTIALLTPEELDTLPPESEHDAWDAAAIWLFAAGRAQRGGVPA